MSGLEIRPVTSEIGAEVRGIDLSQPLEATTRDALFQALVTHHVLFFRDHLTFLEMAMTQERIDAFAEATGDRQWIHTDPERAKQQSPFGRTIAHGYLTISLAPQLIDELYLVEGSSHTVNYGIDRMRLHEPVPADARVRLSAEIRGVRYLPSGAARV